VGADSFLYLRCVLALQHDQVSHDYRLRQARGLLDGRNILLVLDVIGGVDKMMEWITMIMDLMVP
jgi:hypothetical protein